MGLRLSLDEAVLMYSQVYFPNGSLWVQLELAWTSEVCCLGVEDFMQWKGNKCEI